MAGAWRKTMRYLGLVEEDELDEIEHPDTEQAGVPLAREAAPPREAPPRRTRGHRTPSPRVGESESIVRTIPQSRPPSGTIHRAEPKRFNEAREVGERFKDGVPVILNLQETEDATARRLVDFA